MDLTGAVWESDGSLDLVLGVAITDEVSFFKVVLRGFGVLETTTSSVCQYMNIQCL